MRRALGKGLSQLIGEQIADTSPSELPIDSIVPNKRQPRTKFNEESLEELATSIREVGLIQPLVVRMVGDGKYELIAGERRLRASRIAGLTDVPVVVRNASSQVSLEMALIENVQREDISAMECARAYRLLAEEFNLTQEQIAEKVGKSRVSIANTLRLLRLPLEIQQSIEAGRISEGHARALLMLDGPSAQLAMHQRIIEKGLSVRDVEKATRKDPTDRSTNLSPPRLPSQTQQHDPNWQALEAKLCVHFGSPVRLIKESAGGKLSIEYYSDDDLQRILDLIGIG